MGTFGIVVSGIVILGSTLAYIIWLVKRKL
jgi:hypothetical protein